MLLICPVTATPDHGPQWTWGSTTDGVHLDKHGHGLPPTDRIGEACVLVLPAEHLSWHRIALPKTPAGKLRAVLAGLLEDQLLDPPGDMHFALEPGARPDRHGISCWVACCRRQTLEAPLQQLNALGWRVHRIVPAACPTPRPLWAADGQDKEGWITHSGPSGVLRLPALAWRQAPWPTEPPARCLATPSAAGLCEAWFPDQTWEIQPALALTALDQGWDLAQLELQLSAGARRRRAWQNTLQSLVVAPAWRPARWGLVAVLLVQLAGMNLVAWQERQTLRQLQRDIRATLTDTFPDVTVVIDAPLQMQRELERLRTAQGTLSPTDLEPLLEQWAQANTTGARQLQRVEYSGHTVRLEHRP